VGAWVEAAFRQATIRLADVVELENALNRSGDPLSGASVLR
jgi:hypothetical protein